MPLNVKIEKVESAEAKVVELSGEEQNMRQLYMQDGVIDDTEQGALDRIKEKIDRLGTVIADLRAEIERNRTIWEGRAGDLAAARDKLVELRAFMHPEAETVAGEFDAIDQAVADQRWADATAALDQVDVSLGPVYDDYVLQSGAQAIYDPMRVDFDTRLAAAKIAEPQTETIVGLTATIEGNVAAIDAAVVARNYVEAQQLLEAAVGQLEMAEEEIRTIQEAKAEYDAGLQGLASVLETVSVCEFATVSEAQAEVAQIQTQMEAAAAIHDYAAAMVLLGNLEASATPLRDRIVELETKRAEYESGYAPLQARAAEINTSELASTSEAQQTMIDLQTAIETAVAAEEYDTAIGNFPDFDTAITTVETIRADRDLYDSRVAAMQEELLEASVSQEKWAYLGTIQSGMASIQTEMEAAAQAENYTVALEKIGALEAKLAEFFAALAAKKAEYDTARAAMNSQVSAAQGNSTDATKTELAEIKKLIPPVDKAAADEDWVKALAAIPAVLDKIDDFNVAMYQAELPGMTTGMSTDAMELAGRSPELTESLEDLRDAGWQVVVGPAGEGTSASRGTSVITIDANDFSDPGSVVQSLAHEAGHAEYPYEMDDSSRENYMDGVLADEGAATMENIRVQREIIANGGADIGLAGNSANHADYNAAYDQFLEDGDTEAAQSAIGAIYGAGEIPSGKDEDGNPWVSYNQYYGEWYDENYD